MIGGSRVDFWHNTYRDIAFMGGHHVAAVAGQFSHVGLWNTAASGYHLICSRAVGSVPSTQEIEMLGFGTSFGIPAVRPSKFNQAAGATPSNGFIENTNNVAGLGDFSYGLVYVVGGMAFEFIKHDPIILEEDEGLIIRCNTVNIALTGLFEWIEVPTGV